MQLFIKTLDGKTITLEADPEENCGSLKCRAGNLLPHPLPGSQLKFIWAGKELDGEQTLEEQGYTMSDHSSTIILRVDTVRLEKTIKNLRATYEDWALRDDEEVIRTEGMTKEDLEAWRKETADNIVSWTESLRIARELETAPKLTVAQQISRQLRQALEEKALADQYLDEHRAAREQLAARII